MRNYSTEKIFNQAKLLLPHGESLHVIESVLAFDEQSICCQSFEKKPSSMCIVDDLGQRLLMTVSSVEFIAQAAAIGSIMRSILRDDMRARQGFVIRVKNMKIHQNRIKDMTSLLINAAWCGTQSAAYEVCGSVCDTSNPQQVFCEGSLSILEF